MTCDCFKFPGSPFKPSFPNGGSNNKARLINRENIQSSLKHSPFDFFCRLSNEKSNRVGRKFRPPNEKKKIKIGVPLYLMES